MAALAFAFVLAGPAAASAASDVRHAGDSTRTAADVRSYWTPQRMENAKPVGPLKVSAPAPATAEEAPTLQAGSIPYTSGELTDTVSFPNRVHGKVFFSRSGGNFVCSGTAVNAPNLSLVISAGHCVRNDGVWASNWAFVPGYRNGSRPYGTWAATDIAAPSPWVTSEDLRYDVGTAVVAANGSGQALQSVVGARAILFNQPEPVSGAVRSFGYPAQAPFNGSKLRFCDSSLGYRDPLTSDPQTMGIGCDMTGGSSGGGWVAGDSVISVNSYGRPSNPEVMHGPYFGSTIQALYDAVDGEAAGGPTSPAAGPTTTAPSQPAAISRKKCKKRKKQSGTTKRGRKKRCKRVR